MTAGSSEVLTPTAEAFAGFLARVDAGEQPDFDAVCAEHPELSAGLRRLHARWREMQVAMDALGSARRPRSTESSGSTASDALAATDPSASALLERLREKGADAHRLTIKGEIARGGMGAVYKVWDAELRRSLAMKVLARGQGPRLEARALSRFLEEAQITGQLEHPGIVPVHELGLDGDGRVFFTMPLVRGDDLKAIIERVHAGDAKWTLPRALGVVVRVCEAMGYAHARGVIHRDLKPSNVMVGAFGETYVMDWGLARVLSRGGSMQPGHPAKPAASTDLRTVRSDAAASDSSPLVTMDGDVVGTPIYMPPEQAHGWIDEMGPASDVYSIGAILYHLLGGVQPYSTPGEKGTADQVLKAVKSRPPRALHALGPPSPTSPAVAPELAAICEKAMAREPARRYATTMELAEDLRAFLEGRVVRAYEAGAWAELKKWTRRNRRFASAAATALVAVLVGLAVSTALWVRARESADLAHENENHARDQREVAEDRARDATLAQQRADAIAARLADELAASDVERGRLLGRVGSLDGAERVLWREFLRRPFEHHPTFALWELYTAYPCLTTRKLTERSRVRMRYAPSGELITFEDGGALRVWSPDGFEPVRSTRTADVRAASLAIIGEAELLATATYEGGELELRRTADLSLVGRVDAHAGGIFGMDVRPDGVRIATTGREGVLREWSVPELELVREVDLGEGEAQGVRYAPDGGSLAFGTFAGRVHLLVGDATTPARSWQPHTAGASMCLEFTEGGRRLVSGSRRRELRTWRIDDDEVERRPAGTNGTIRDLLLLSDGETLVSVGWYRVEFHDASTLSTLASFGIPSGAVDLAESPDGKTLAVGLGIGSVSLFEIEPRAGLRAIRGDAKRSVAAFHPDGRSLAIGRAAGEVELLRATTAEPQRRIRAGDGSIVSLCFSADGSFLATVDERGAAVVRHLPSDTVVLELDGVEDVTRRVVHLSQGGGLIGVALREGRFAVLDVESGEPVAEVQVPGAQSLSIVLLPELGLFATTSREHQVRLWTLAGEPAGTVELGNTPWSLTRDARGRIVTGGWGKDIAVIDPVAGVVLNLLDGHAGTVWDAAFHPTEPDLLASCGDDGYVRLWDLASGRNVLALDVSDGLGPALAEFSPEGDALVVSGAGRPLRIDLLHYQRHIAGNLRRQIEALRDEVGVAIDEAALLGWADDVLSRDVSEFRGADEDGR